MLVLWQLVSCLNTAKDVLPENFADFFWKGDIYTREIIHFSKIYKALHSCILQCYKLQQDAWQTSRTTNNHRNMSYTYEHAHTFKCSECDRILFSYFWAELLEVWRVITKPTSHLFYCLSQRRNGTLYLDPYDKCVTSGISQAPLIISSTFRIWEVMLVILQMDLLVLCLERFEKCLVSPKSINIGWSIHWARQ